MKKIILFVACSGVVIMLFEKPVVAQNQERFNSSSGSQAKDPGVRAGSVTAGKPISTLSPSQLNTSPTGWPASTKSIKLLTDWARLSIPIVAAAVTLSRRSVAPARRRTSTPTLAPILSWRRLPRTAPQTKYPPSSRQTVRCGKPASLSPSIPTVRSVELPMEVSTVCSPLLAARTREPAILLNLISIRCNSSAI